MDSNPANSKSVDNALEGLCRAAAISSPFGIIPRRKKISMSRYPLLFSLALGTGVALAAPNSAVSNESARQVMAAEEARTAALDHSDVSALERIVGDDLTYVHASGRVDTKSSYLAAIRSGQLHYISWQAKNLQVRVLGNTAVINGEYAVRVTDSRVQRTPFDINILVLSVYARRDGQWQQIAWQSTRDVETPPAH
jgi:hypothetical protein